MKTRESTARETIRKIRSYLRFGSNHASDTTVADFKYGHAIRAAVLIAALKNMLCQINPTFHIFSKLNSLAIQKYGYGQCGEQAQAAFIDLIENEIYPLDFCMTTKGEHNLIVIGRAANSNPDDISTWGKDTIICDPWINKVYPLSEFENMKKDISFGEYNKKIYGSSSMPPHYLSGKINILYSIKNIKELREFKQAIKIDADISHFFSFKITSDEDLRLDVEKMKDMLNAVKDSNFRGHPAVITKLHEIEEELSALEKELSLIHEPTFLSPSRRG